MAPVSLSLAFSALLGAVRVGALPNQLRREDIAGGCPPFNNGTFIVHQEGLYPENADWDAKNCLIYFGALFNSSVAVYDPYTATMRTILTFPNITHNPNLHIGGVGVDPYHADRVTIVVDAANPFATGGNDVSGDNFIIKYDSAASKVLWMLNITAVTQGRYGAFQDVEHDARGYTYIVGTYPGTVMRVDPEGRAVTPWYLPAELAPTSRVGFTGLAAVKGTDILLSSDAGKGELYRFDMATPDGKGVPVLVPRSVPYSNATAPALAGTDAVYLPPMYGGAVLLVSENGKGITVLRSKDRKWETAEHLGTIPNNSTLPEAAGGLNPATVQVGDRNVFIVEEFFADPPVNGTTTGDRKLFPLVDITAQVEALLRK